MVGVANRKKLKFWAMLQNISNFARGVGYTAECTFAFFDHTLSAATRERPLNKMTGNNKAGRALNNSLQHKQSLLFRGCKALVFACDNYQRGLTLQEQQGKLSSAFFKGPHKCVHNMFQFEDTTFDDMHPYFSQHDQDIPLLWGMPVFEIVNEDAIVDLFMDYESFQTATTPDFTGEQYLWSSTSSGAFSCGCKIVNISRTNILQSVIIR
mmetsp:Transcript_14435/g.30712  ORF Transcript_14435/g.30712 Transcript_14435/m.30712 type:complete len:210 (+) Transcript_14435:239-868(+)